jgi:hypothetical protein
MIYPAIKYFLSSFTLLLFLLVIKFDPNTLYSKIINLKKFHINLGDFYSKEIYLYLDLSIVYVSIYFFLLTGIIYSTVATIRLKTKEIFCENYLNKNSISYSLCKGKITSLILSVAVSIVFSFNLMLFIYLSSFRELSILFADTFLFFIIYKITTKSISSQLNKKAHYVISATVTISINSALLAILYFLVNFFSDNSFKPFDIGIIDYVIESTNHSFHMFQRILRLSEFVDLNISSLKNDKNIGTYLFTFIYALNSSMFSFMAISFLLHKQIKID